MQKILEITADGHLVLPEQTLHKFRFSAGMKFKLLADNDGVLVLKLLDMPVARSGVTENELQLQQAALDKMWNNPAEDIYNDEI